MLLEQWGVPIAVCGMLLATLLMAAIVRRYQEYHAVLRSRVQSLERGTVDVADALAALRRVPLSRELRLALRGDVLARYTQIRKLYRRYPDIESRVLDAESAMNAEGAPSGGGVGPIEDEQAFRKVLAALDCLSDRLARGGTLAPIPRDVAAIFLREIGERRAEAHARFHLVQSSRHLRDHDRSRARAHLTTLLQVLKRNGPSTDFVRELYAEAQQALENLSNPKPAEAPTSDAADSAPVAG